MGVFSFRFPITVIVERIITPMLCEESLHSKHNIIVLIVTIVTVFYISIGLPYPLKRFFWIPVFVHITIFIPNRYQTRYKSKKCKNDADKAYQCRVFSQPF